MSDTPPTYHSNAVNAHGNGFDVALDFGYRLSPAEGVSPGVRVTMSWEHLRVMLPLLQKMVDEYEEKVGQIPRVDEAAAREGQEVGP